MSNQTCPKWTPEALQGTARFPAFWVPYFDWMPDQDHGGNFANMFQSMLMTYNLNNDIYLLQGWPENWDVRFKLHAPGGQVIEASYKNGELKKTVENENSEYTIHDMSTAESRLRNMIEIGCNDYNYSYGKENIIDGQYDADQAAQYTVTGDWLKNTVRVFRELMQGSITVRLGRKYL